MSIATEIDVESAWSRICLHIWWQMCEQTVCPAASAVRRATVLRGNRQAAPLLCGWPRLDGYRGRASAVLERGGDLSLTTTDAGDRASVVDCGDARLRRAPCRVYTT